MKKGLFITIEGTDGSGKSTQIAKIKDYFIKNNSEVILLREPGGTKISEKIRELILDLNNKEMSNTAEVLLYAAARAQLVAEVILPLLKEGKTVVCDRFIDSSYAYQGFGRGISMEIIESANEAALCGLMPELTIFLDVAPEIALKRRMKASEADRLEMEKMEFHQRVYEGYKHLSDKYCDRIVTIDANRAPEEIWVDIENVLNKIEM
jgi:dTMP kinase